MDDRRRSFSRNRSGLSDSCKVGDGPNLLQAHFNRELSAERSIQERISYLAGIVLATARAQSMKTRATGLNVRFFSLIMATGLG
jgi:hypothetical protein